MAINSAVDDEVGGVKCRLVCVGGAAYESDSLMQCTQCRKPSRSVFDFIIDGIRTTTCLRDKCWEKLHRKLRFALEHESVQARFISMPRGLATETSRKRERSRIGYKIRYQVLIRGNCRCAVCGSTESLVIDHIVPICKGGTSDIENLQVLCFKCNSGKGGS